MSAMAVALLLVIFVTIILYVVNYFWKFLTVSELSYKGFRLLRYSSSRFDLRRKAPKFPNSSHLDTFELFNGHFVIEIAGFSIKFQNLKLNISINTINLFLNSGFFNSSASSTSLVSKCLLYIIKSMANFLHIEVASFCLYATVGDCKNSKSYVLQTLSIKKFVVFESKTDLLSVEALLVDQFLISESESSKAESILRAQNFRIIGNIEFNQFDLSFSESVYATINVRLLFFVSSFLKSLPNSDVDNESDVTNYIPWPTLINVSVTGIFFKISLPETDPSIKYFESLQCIASRLNLLCFIPRNGIPKLTLWLSCFKLVTKSAPKALLGSKHFCPIDYLLLRGPEYVAGLSKDLLVFESIILSNWSEKCPKTNSPVHFISDWIKSVLQGSPNCSIQSDYRSNFIVPELDLSFFDDIKDCVSAAKLLTLQFFLNCSTIQNKTVYGVFEQLKGHVPFEYPVSSLIDHLVVLFKAGWRPLSKKTEQGYWIGDGDKFLKSDWAINLHIKRTIMSIEDDKFESKISAIMHFQRQIAESRCRLESALLSKITPSADVSVSPQLYRLAQCMSVTSDKISSNQVVPLINLQKSLFSEYRTLLQKTHLLTNWSLTDLSFEDLKVCLSWSPEYLGSDGSLSNLLNKIENGSQMTSESIENLSTFIGGFFDISGKSVQVNLRNYSRPILIAPSLHARGPMFMVEDGVKDPDVLIKFPVRVLPENSSSSFSHLPEDGIVCVLRSIIPLKMYHCVHFTVDDSQLVQMTVSPYWLGCLALLDRVIDRFVKSSTEDPSPPLPGWDKLRYNVRGCHSRLTISSPCIISRILDSDPLSCREILSLSFPNGLDVGLTSSGNIVLNCPEASLTIDSQHLFRIKAALESSGPLHLWDLGVSPELSQPTMLKSRNFSRSSMDFTSSSVIPIIKLSKTHLELSFKVKNIFNEEPCHHWTVHPIARSNAPNITDWVSIINTMLTNNNVFRSTMTRLKILEANRLPWSWTGWLVTVQLMEAIAAM